MTVALPVPGPNDLWGNQLNGFLAVAHNPDGTLNFSKGITIPDSSDVSTGLSRASFFAAMANPPGANQNRDVLKLTGTGRGTSVTGVGLRGLDVLTQDDASVVNKAISGAANNGAGLIRVTCTGHTFATGDKIAIYGVAGAIQANGAWTITVINANTFDLQGSTFSSAYTSGGTATNRPYMNGIYVGVKPSLARGGLTGTAANGDDADGIAIQNIGTGIATDAFYLAASTTVAGHAWVNGFAIAADVQFAAFLFGGVTAGYGLDLDANAGAVYQSGAAAIRVPNNVPAMVARNAANNADVEMFRFDNFNEIVVAPQIHFSGTIAVGDGVSIVLGTSTGNRIGSSTAEKLGFFGATPVVRPAGWTAATNTKTRTTFDTTTVTLPVLAAHVGALVDDLIALGLIGA